MILITFKVLTDKSIKKFKRHRDYGFFDQDIRLSILSQFDDSLEKLNPGEDFELFHSLLVINLAKQSNAPGSRSHYN